jgi:hypothetical protein
MHEFGFTAQRSQCYAIPHHDFDIGIASLNADITWSYQSDKSWAEQGCSLGKTIWVPILIPSTRVASGGVPR